MTTSIVAGTGTAYIYTDSDADFSVGMIDDVNSSPGSMQTAAKSYLNRRNQKLHSRFTGISSPFTDIYLPG